MGVSPPAVISWGFRRSGLGWVEHLCTLCFLPLSLLWLVKVWIPPTSLKCVNVFVGLSFIVHGDICTCSVCKADVFLFFFCFFKEQWHFNAQTILHFVFLHHAVQAGLVQWQMLQCDMIPPPVALQPALYSLWDEERTKTDKLTAVCNLRVKAKWKGALPLICL